METDFDTVTHQCICGSPQFKIVVSFEEYEIATYSLEMYCVECGLSYKTPTPLDNPASLY